MFSGKHILLGVTGSIAAYKAAVLTRSLVREGAQVQVVMTPLAKQFITPLTMATLSRNPILVDFFDPENGAWNSHVSLGEWADLYLIAPATANTLGKMAHGIADNLLLTTVPRRRSSRHGPGHVRPPHHAGEHRKTAVARRTHRRTRRRGAGERPHGQGPHGRTGRDRRPDAQDTIVTMSLAGKYLLVTAGPTIEPLDPVRFLSNHSTGKMGYAIAGELATRGARVALISGRTNLAAPAGVERIDVLSAEEMYRAVMERFPQADGAVMCAAVADYTPAQVSTTKLKKGEGDLVIRLKRTKDIAAEAGRTKGGRLLVGFALETDHERDNALDKMRRKHFDFIVLNSLRDPGAGFAGDTNKITLMDAQGGIDEYPLETKSAAAVRIADRIERWFSDRPATR